MMARFHQNFVTETLCSQEFDPYTGQSLVWLEEHFEEETTTEDRMSRSLDDFCTAVDDDFSRQPMSLSAVEDRVCDKRVKKHAQKSATPNGPSEAEEKDHAAILKTKFLSAFTNVKNGWVVKTSASFSCESTTWLLGVSYKFSKSDFEERNQCSSVATTFDKFKLDFRSRLWMTYRKDFPKLDGSQLTNDIGWGCMMRSGQMLLAQAFVMHFLGRDWMWRNDAEDVETHRKIIRYFGDTLNRFSPFSVQTMVGIGRKLGRNPGDWYGPASISTVLRDALQQADDLPELKDLCIYVAMDGVLFIQDVFDLISNVTSGASQETDPVYDSGVSSLPASADNSNQKWRSVIILVPLRLGSESLNSIYIPCLKTVLCHPLCIGIIGGKPKHSMYFIGFQDEKLILLDPHCCQDCVDVLKTDFPLDSFHCSFPRKLPFSKMDPTCTLGFYCKTREDFDKFLLEIPKITMPPSHESYPLFHFQFGSRAEFETRCRDSSNPYNCQSVRLVSRSDNGSLSVDDFTLL